MSERTQTKIERRLSELQELNRAKRGEKVTAEDVRHQLAASRSERRNDRVGRRHMVTAVLGFGLLVGAGVSAVATTSSVRSYEASAASLAQQILESQSNLRAIPASEPELASEYAETVQAQLEVATVKGEEVASLQQGFSEILSGQGASGSQDGVASSAGVAAAAHRQKLEPYFVDRSFLVEGSVAYAPLSLNPFGAEEIDPRFPWFVAPGSSDQRQESAGWRLASVQPAAANGVFEAIWLNREGSGDLLAWAKASYYSDTEQFGSLTVGTTTLGERAAALSTAGE